jgi:rhodanese-related sulfurtransferase
VLDVREPWELQTASVKPDGFELVSMPMRSVPARYLELDRNRPIACLCHHGARSAQVVHFLMQQGFTNTVNIHGGINAWSHERDTGVPTY